MQHWRIVFGLTLITIVIQTLLLIFIYKEETPKYLLLNGREEECRIFI
ncbi:MAG: hypothetical protein E6Q89_02545 [Bacteroidia bacterium]|nr:MAG: hypothetical protein E6Q89_02545 [Bacteroidia bacterium]